MDYEFKKAVTSVIAELTAAGWTFGSHPGYTGITVDPASRTIALPEFYKDDLINGSRFPKVSSACSRTSMPRDE